MNTNMKNLIEESLHTSDTEKLRELIISAAEINNQSEKKIEDVENKLEILKMDFKAVKERYSCAVKRIRAYAKSMEDEVCIPFETEIERMTKRNFGCEDIKAEKVPKKRKEFKLEFGMSVSSAPDYYNIEFDNLSELENEIFECYDLYFSRFLELATLYLNSSEANPVLWQKYMPGEWDDIKSELAAAIDEYSYKD